MTNPSTIPPHVQKKLENKFHKAINYLKTGNLKQASSYCHAILKIQPNHSHAFHILALIEKQQGKTQQALKYFQKAIAIEPANAMFYYNMAVTYHEAGNAEQAINTYIKSVDLNPQNPAALDNLGILFQSQSKFNEAIHCHKKALEINPQIPSVYNNLGECFRQQFNYELALEYYLKAIELQPDYVSALKNAGNLYKELGQFDKAMEYLNSSANFSANPSDPQNSTSDDSQWNQATMLLLQGRYQEGWYKYEYGINEGTRTFVDYGFPIWKDESLEGKNILVVGEQGIGDEIMFATCFKDIIQKAGHCYIECEPRLLPLFQRSFPGTTLIARGDNEQISKLKQSQAIDLQILSGSLPKIFRNHLDLFPRQKNLLKADGEKLNYWKQELKKMSTRLKIGISWRGGNIAQVQKKRSTELEQWKEILSYDKADFICLQYGECHDDLAKIKEQFDLTVHELEGIDSLKDLDNYAALIASLDLVISIDNSVVHLAAAVGTQVWAMLPYVPDWRWQLDCKDSPWYETVSLFRQTKKDDWSTVFSTVAKRLDDGIKKKAKHKAGKKQQKALLLNDTSSWYHWGCTCTSTAILNSLKEQDFNTSSIPIQDSQECLYPPGSIDDFDSQPFRERFIQHNQVIIEQIKKADIIVLNGEGTLHNLNKQALIQLYLAHIAKIHFGKSVHIINHSCYPNDSACASDAVKDGFYSKIYKEMDSIAIREGISAELMERLGVKVTRSFDCLPLYLEQQPIAPVNKKKNRILIAGSVILAQEHIDQMTQYMKKMHEKGYQLSVLTGARAFPAKEDLIFVEKLKEQSSVDWELIDAKSAEEWLTTIAEASLLVSGRFHHSIAAACLKTPFIALYSNTPKMEGIMDMLKLNPPTSYNIDELPDFLLARSQELLDSETEGRVDDKVLNQIRKLAKANFSNIKVTG